MNLAGSCVVLAEEQPLDLISGSPSTYRTLFGVSSAIADFETTMVTTSSEVKFLERTGRGLQECVTPIPVSECRADGLQCISARLHESCLPGCATLVLSSYDKALLIHPRCQNISLMHLPRRSSLLRHSSTPPEACQICKAARLRSAEWRVLEQIPYKAVNRLKTGGRLFSQQRLLNKERGMPARKNIGFDVPCGHPRGMHGSPPDRYSFMFRQYVEVFFSNQPFPSSVTPVFWPFPRSHCGYTL